MFLLRLIKMVKRATNKCPRFFLLSFNQMSYKDIQWGYGQINIPYVGKTYYTIKLRVNLTTYSWFSDEATIMFNKTTIKNNFVTVEFVSEDYNKYVALKELINKAQQDHLEAYLQVWKIHGYKVSMNVLTKGLAEELIVNDVETQPESVVVEEPTVVEEPVMSIEPNMFITCTEADVDEVFSMMNSLGFTTEGFGFPGWSSMCTGVRIYSDKTYQCFHNHHGDLKEISLEDFRSKFLEWMNS